MDSVNWIRFDDSVFSWFDGTDVGLTNGVKRLEKPLRSSPKADDRLELMLASSKLSN